ncbi:MAG: hypothetical protein Q4B26_14440 [Eubacteriales bacterium]|nr:hypothetical protein [Eubacteriales bacterium]
MSISEMTPVEFWEKLMGLTNWKLINMLGKDSRIEKITRGELLAEQNQRMEDVPFLISGVAKGYWRDEYQKEHLFCFGYLPGTPLTAITSLEKETISLCNIEIAREGQALFVPVKRLYELVQSELDASRLYSSLLEKSFQEMVERAQVTYSLPAAQRYRWFRNRYPGLEQWITGKDVASFLHLAPASLSRLKGRFQAEDERATAAEQTVGDK